VKHLGNLPVILSGEERATKYARLSIADRQVIVDILRETKKDLALTFRGAIH
jgi:hypothetical protein